MHLTVLFLEHIFYTKRHDEPSKSYTLSTMLLNSDQVLFSPMLTPLTVM